MASLLNRRKVKEFALLQAQQRAHKFTRVGGDFYVKCEANLREFIRKPGLFRTQGMLRSSRC